MKEATMRTTLFVLFVAVFLVLALLVEITGSFDDAMMVYIYAALLDIISLSLWSVWWFLSRKKPTFIFSVVGLLFLTVLYYIVVDMYGRNMLLTDFEAFREFTRRNFWTYRHAPLVIVFSWLCSWVVSRFFGKKESEEQGEKMKILIVDDEKAIAEMVKNLILSMGDFQVDLAFTYDSAVSLFEPGKYSCVVLDLVLGSFEGDGAAFAEQVRASDLDVYIAVITGHWESKNWTRVSAFADDLIRKPFELDYFKLKFFIWVSVYSRRLRLRRYVDNADAQTRQEVRDILKGKFKSLFDRRP